MKNKLLVLSAFWIILFSPAYSQNQIELVGEQTTVDTRDSILDEWLTGPIFEVDTRDALALALSSDSISENQPAGSEVGRFRVVGDGSATYSLVSGQGSSGNSNFTLSSTGVLKTAKSFDYEQTQEHSIRVGATVSGKVPTEKIFAITVLDELEPPALSFTLSQNKVKENQRVGTEVGFFYQDFGSVPDAPSFGPGGLPEMLAQSHEAENPTGENITPTRPTIFPDFPEIFTLVLGEGATHNHLFEMRNGVLRTAAVLDFETAPVLSIRIKDKGFSKAEQVFAITVEDTEEPVQNEISLSNSSVMEKQPVGTEVGSFRINGKVDSGYMFSLVGGKGGAYKEKFTVNGNVLSTASTLSASTDSSLAIRVQAMKVSFVNGLPEFDLLDQTFTIQVQEQPVTNGLVLSRDSVWEGLPVGTTLTKIGSWENSAFVASSNAYSLATGSGDDHNSWFTIEGNKVIAKQPLNSNDSPVLRFRVVENESGLSHSFSLKVEKSTQPFMKPYENALITLKKLQKEVADLNATHRQNEDTLIAGHEQNEALRKALDAKETQLKKLKEENLKLVGQEKELEKEVVSLEEKMAAAVERIANLNQRISDSSSQLSVHEEEMKKILKENETLGEIAKVPHLNGWHYLPNQGWILVDPDYYPLVYQTETNSWFTYEQGSSRSWNYYNHATEQWEAWE